ncbi:hypothetical protein BKA62DRAFT_774081 [Auriculariales sp. MPI-PUGE-AT-0066]|nr:hypothetical protein BKA62DRAFT_774081 [Auriculariales sp. MPI-PUGE-AT-0066]
MLQLVAVVWTIAVNLLSAASAWTWPNPQFEDLDSARWDIDGYAPRLAIGAGLRPDCTPWIRGPGHGRSNAADWVRTAFHDMATYDPVTGMGGLDASIRLEAGRPENAGNGFSMTLLFFRNSPGRYLSMADILALALVGVFEHWYVRHLLELVHLSFVLVVDQNSSGAAGVSTRTRKRPAIHGTPPI